MAAVLVALYADPALPYLLGAAPLGVALLVVRRVDWGPP